MAYKLSIQFTAGTDTDIASNGSASINVTDIYNTSQSCKLSILATSYHKKVYQPGEVVAKLKLKRDSYPGDNSMQITPNTVIELFRNKAISLTRDNGNLVAQDYYIYKVLPAYQRDTSGYQYVTITCYCYSRDHKLTLNPYCRAYVNKKLVGTDATDGIIQKELSEGILYAAGFTTSNINFANLRLLHYLAVTKRSIDKSAALAEVEDTTETREFIQPYLVQYNESFYDFLARTANRCGEFLYHEGGKLYIGTPASTANELDASKVLSYQYVGYSIDPIAPEAMYTDGMDLSKKEDPIYAENGKSYFSYDEVPFDEYLGMYLYANRSNAKQFGKQRWREIIVDSVNAILNHPSLDRILTEIYLKYMAAIDEANTDLAKQKKDDKTYMEAALDEQKDAAFEEDKDKNKNDFKIDENLRVTLYGSLLTKESKRQNYEELHNLNAKFYRFVNRCTHDVSRQLVEVDVDTNSATRALGDVVTFNGETYIVVEVKETLREEKWEDGQTSTGQTIVLAPKYIAEVTAYNPNTKLDQYSYTNEDGKAVEVKREYVYQKSTNEAAFVSADEDDFKKAKKKSNIKVEQDEYSYKDGDDTILVRRHYKYTKKVGTGDWTEITEEEFNVAKIIANEDFSQDEYTYKDGLIKVTVKRVIGTGYTYTQAGGASSSETEFNTAKEAEQDAIKAKDSHTYQGFISVKRFYQYQKKTGTGAWEDATEADYTAAKTASGTKYDATTDSYTYTDSNNNSISVKRYYKYQKSIDGGTWQDATEEDFNRIKKAKESRPGYNAQEDEYTYQGTITIQRYYQYQKKTGTGAWKDATETDYTTAKNASGSSYDAGTDTYTYTSNGQSISVQRAYVYSTTKDSGVSFALSITEFNAALNREIADNEKKDEHTYTNTSGQKITVKRAHSGVTYTISKNGGKAKTATKADFDKARRKSAKENAETDDVYDIKTELCFFCPPAVVPFVKTCGTQRAFVARTKDPQGYGRVCIRYPWQHADDEPSPWIRMAVPFAPNDGCDGRSGFFFEPDKDDEVLVDYENGNIEHPFIVGSLYTHRTKAPHGTRSIVSRKGHSITFNDSDSVLDFIASLNPGLKILMTAVDAIPGAKLDTDECMAGGVTLTDRWGFYKISASTTSRKVTINSAFGDVLIDAFTGITINAPNGDVKIKGKNVTIEAGNNLTLRSGTNIDEKYAAGSWKDKFKAIGLSAVKKISAAFLAPIADLKLARTVQEAFLKPIAGTLTIESGRYLLLSAGGAKPEIPHKGLNVRGMQKLVDNEDDLKKMALTIHLIHNKSEEWVETLKVKYDDVRILLGTVNLAASDAYIGLTNPAPANLIQNIWSHLDSKYKEEDFTFTAGPRTRYHEYFIHNVEVLREKLQDLHSYCNSLMNADSKLLASDSHQQYLMSDLKKAVKKTQSIWSAMWIGAVANKTENTFADYAAEWDDLKKVFRRAIIYQLITSTKIMKQDPATLPDIFDTWHACIVEDWWDDYVKNLIICEVSSSHWDTNPFLNAIKSPFVENWNELIKYGWSDKDLWDTSKQGEILMSDKEGIETMSIVNGAITRTTNRAEHHYKDDIITKLNNL